MNTKAFGWDLPAGTSDRDLKAPWNAPDHAKACPCHEDAEPVMCECEDECVGECQGHEVEPMCICADLSERSE